ncbi:MAG TPA: hypothetical protein VN915_12195 [Elusimicrobiota bacterium]|nr:hypothetical protein [Elusimicrobiota bacterium]
MVKALGLAALLALAGAPPRASAQQAAVGTKPLELRDPAKDLQAAEEAIARGGGADAYAARADAKRSLGRPFQEYIVDYAEAARRDPKKYGEKFRGIMEQQESETKHEVKRYKSTAAGQKDANVLTKLLFIPALAILLLIASLVLIRGRARGG